MVQNKKQKNSNSLIIVASVIIILIVLGVIAFSIWDKKDNETTEDNNAVQLESSESSIPDLENNNDRTETEINTPQEPDNIPAPTVIPGQQR